MTLQQLLTRLKELHERATPAKWEWRPTGLVPNLMASLSILHSHNRTPHVSHQDAELITEMRSALPLLLQVIETQREALEFYASTTRWEATTHDSTYDGIGCTDFQTFKSISMGPSQVGGKTARQALARCEKVIQEGMK